MSSAQPSPVKNPSSLPAALVWTNRALFSLVWPLIIEQLLAVCMGMADTVMVAAVGESAVSAVALVDNINVLLITLLAALATGGAVVTSQYIGRGDAKSASGAARQLVYAVSLVSLVLAAIVLIFRRPLLQLLFGHVEAGVFAQSETYLWLSAVSYPFIALYNAGSALFRSMGNSRVGMLVALLVNVLNIGGNALLIFGFGMGVAGAAISTLVSRAVAAVVLLWLLRRSSGSIKLTGLFRFSFDFALIKQILKIGVPNGLENSVFQIGKLVLNRLISLFGTAAIAANAVAGSVDNLVILPIQAFGLALLTVVGQCVGAGDYAAAKKNTWKIMRMACLLLLALNLLKLATLEPVLNILALSPEGTNLARQFIVLHAIASNPVWAFSFPFPNALRAAGDARFTMGVSMFSMVMFRIVLGYLFSLTLGMGAIGVWYAMVVDWFVRSGLFLWRWRSGRWQKHRVIE